MERLDGLQGVQGMNRLDATVLQNVFFSYLRTGSPLLDGLLMSAVVWLITALLVNFKRCVRHMTNLANDRLLSASPTLTLMAKIRPTGYYTVCNKDYTAIVWFVTQKCVFRSTAASMCTASLQNGESYKEFMPAKDHLVTVRVDASEGGPFDASIT